MRRFIEEADPDLAKKVGAHASSLLVEALGSPLESRLAIRTSFPQAQPFSFLTPEDDNPVFGRQPQALLGE
jgi:hypothetical protein